MRHPLVRAFLGLLLACPLVVFTWWLARPLPVEGLTPLESTGTRPDARQRDSQASSARAEAIRQAAEHIEAEYQAAGGDWSKWQQQTAPYRAALLDKIEHLPLSSEMDYSRGLRVRLALAGWDGFPVLETDSRGFLSHLYDPHSVDGFRSDRPVVAADRWLATRGIDLIFVPVPKMTEVYVEHFLNPCPPDGIIAPHVRLTLLELLRSQVETVDGLALFRAVRDNDPEYLYNSGEAHWAPRGQRVMAAELAERITRYEFGARAKAAAPVVRTQVGLYKAPDSIVLAVEQQLLEPVLATTQLEVRTLDGKPVPDDPTSPVLLIGNSYCTDFREQLIRELNMPIRTRISNNQTTEAFDDFLREPELLKGVKLVVWVTTEQHFTRFKPLPEPIAAAGR
jgi:hypothetical protein